MLLVTGGAGFIGSNVVADLNEAGRADVAISDVLGSDDKWRNLARRQEEVNKQLEPLTNSAPAQRAQQQARQSELGRQTGELMPQLAQMPGDGC